MPFWYLRGEYPSVAQGYRRRLRSGGASDAFQVTELVLAPEKYQRVDPVVTSLDLTQNPAEGSIIVQAQKVWLRYLTDVRAGCLDGWAQLARLDKLWEAGRTDEIEPVLATEDSSIVFGWNRIIAAVGKGQHTEIPAMRLRPDGGFPGLDEEASVISIEATRTSKELISKASKLRHLKQHQWLLAFRPAGSNTLEAFKYINHASAQYELRLAQKRITRSGAIELWRLRSMDMYLDDPIRVGEDVHESELSKLYAPVNSTRLVSTGKLTTHQRYKHLRVIRDVNHG